MDFKDTKDSAIMEYLAFATELPNRIPTLAPRNDKVFNSSYNSVGLWVSSRQPRVKIKQNRAGQCDKGIKDLSISG